MMEPNTQALEVVCRHFKATYGEEAFTRMRNQKVKVQGENYRLRKKVARLEESLRTARHLIQTQAQIIAKAGQIRACVARLLQDMF